MLRYFLCAYGTSHRISVKVATEEEAARYCYGVTSRVTCVPIGTKSWKYLARRQKDEIYHRLKKLHKEQTGYDI